MEHFEGDLPPDKAEILQNCLVINKSKYYDYDATCDDYFQKTGKVYHEESDPPVFHVFEYDRSVRVFRPNRQHSVIPRAAINFLPEEYSKFSQRDKDEFFKNKQFADIMNRLIHTFQKRDTKGNIMKLQEELDGLAAQTNPLKKCLSMYKIKEKMDKIENNTKEEEEQAKKKKDEIAH